MPATPVTNLTIVDYAVMAIYFAVVLGVGWILRRVMRTSTGPPIERQAAPPPEHSGARQAL